jgi:hypothetical protein
MINRRGFNLLEPSPQGLQPARTVTAGASTCSNRHGRAIYLLEPSILGQILTVPAGQRVGRVAAVTQGVSTCSKCHGGGFNLLEPSL